MLVFGPKWAGRKGLWLRAGHSQVRSVDYILFTGTVEVISIELLGRHVMICMPDSKRYPLIFFCGSFSKSDSRIYAVGTKKKNCPNSTLLQAIPTTTISASILLS